MLKKRKGQKMFWQNKKDRLNDQKRWSVEKGINKGVKGGKADKS